MRHDRHQRVCVLCEVMTFVEIVGKDLEALVFRERKPFDAGLSIPRCHIPALGKDSVGLVHSGCLVGTLHIDIPLRMELIVHICDECQVLSVLSCDREHSPSLPLQSGYTLLIIKSTTGVKHVQIGQDRSFLEDVAAHEEAEVLRIPHRQEGRTEGRHCPCRCGCW